MVCSLPLKGGFIFKLDQDLNRSDGKAHLVVKAMLLDGKVEEAHHIREEEEPTQVGGPNPLASMQEVRPLWLRNSPLLGPVYFSGVSCFFLFLGLLGLFLLSKCRRWRCCPCPGELFESSEISPRFAPRFKFSWGG